jgi:UDP-glucose 4-epimerase
MKILVTGAGGFVGKRLVAHLVAADHEVVALVRQAPAGEDARYFAGCARILEQDVTRLDPAALPRDTEALVTLAQSSRFRDFPAQAEDVFAVNVTANLALLQWAIGAGVRRVVHASSGGIYGGRTDGQLQESDLLAVDSPLGFYLGSKLCSEIVMQNFRHLFESVVILRPFFIYGPRQRTDMFVARMIDSVRWGRPIQLQGRDGLRVNPVHVDDAVLAFARALTIQGNHVINVAGPDVMTLRTMCGIIGAAMDRQPIFAHKEGEPVDYVGDTLQAEHKLGFRPVSFRTGIDRTLDADRCLAT